MESACAVLGARTMMALALALGLDRDFFYDRHPMLHDGSRSRSRKTYIRANFYPPFKGGGMSKSNLRREMTFSIPYFR